MTREDIYRRVGVVIGETLGLDRVEVGPATTAGDVDGWDSLANVQIFVALERAFGVRFRTGEIASIANVGQLVDRIAVRLGV